MTDPAASLFSHAPFKVGSWYVEPREMRMTRNGEVRKMTRKMMEVLICLAASQGVARSKHEIMDAVWSDVFVSDGTVRRTISQLRHLLDDPADRPIYIETVPSLGYRLIATVEHLDAPAFPSPSLSPALPSETSGQNTVAMAYIHRFWPLLLVAVLALLLWTFWPQNNPTPPAPPLQKIQVTSFLGDEINPVLSPDAQRIVFTRIQKTDAGPRADLYVKMVDAAPHLQLTNDEAFEATATWSPDGLHIAYTATLNDAPAASSPEENCGLYRITAIGGAPRRLASCTLLPDGQPPTLSWSPDGLQLAYPRFDPDTRGSALYHLALDSRTEVPLTIPPAGVLDLEPRHAPADDRLAFVRRYPDRSAIMLLDTATPETSPEEIFSTPNPMWNLYWQEDGHAVYVVTASEDHIPELWYVSLSGNLRRRLQLPADVAVGMQTSIRHNRLAYTHMDVAADLWSLEIGQQTPERLALSSSRHDLAPAIDPGGQKLAFLSNRRNDVTLWIGDISQANTEDQDLVELAPMQGTDFTALVWDNMGNHIVYGSNSGLFSIEQATGRSTEWTDQSVGTLHRDRAGTIYYTTPEHVMRLTAGNTLEVLFPLTPEMQLLGVRQDTLFAQAPVENQGAPVLWRYILHDTSVERVRVAIDFQLKDVAPIPWIFTPKGLYNVRMSPVPALYYFDFEAGRSNQIYQFQAGMPRHVALSGNRIFYDLEQLRGIDVMLLEAFDQGL